MMGLLLTMDAVKAGRSSCQSVTTDFRLPSNTITINSITGIPNGEQVEIRCQCLAPKRTAAEWSYNDESLPTSLDDDDDDEPYVDSTLTRVTLRVNSFGEDSSGLYICHSRDTIVEFNLAWYDSGKSVVIQLASHYNHTCILAYCCIYITYFRSQTTVCSGAKKTECKTQKWR